MIHSFFVFSACAEVVPRLTSAVVPGQSILRVRGGSSEGGVQVIEGLFVFSAHAEVVHTMVFEIRWARRYSPRTRR